MAKLFSRLFNTGTGSGAEITEFYSDRVEDKARRKKIRSIEIPQEIRRFTTGDMPFTTDGSLPGVRVRYDASREEGTSGWEIRQFLDIKTQEGEILPPGLKNGEQDDICIGRPACDFDALRELSEESARRDHLITRESSLFSAFSSPYKGHRDMPHWRCVAEKAGQPVDKNGHVQPVVAGCVLADHVTFDDPEQINIRDSSLPPAIRPAPKPVQQQQTAPPAEKEPGSLEKIFKSAAAIPKATLKIVDRLDKCKDVHGPIRFVGGFAGVMTGASFYNSVDIHWLASLSILGGLATMASAFSGEDEPRHNSATAFVMALALGPVSCGLWDAHPETTAPDAQDIAYQARWADRPGPVVLDSQGLPVQAMPYDAPYASWSYKNAARYCEKLEAEGHEDWQLPDIKTLENLFAANDGSFTDQNDTVTYRRGGEKLLEYRSSDSEEAYSFNPARPGVRKNNVVGMKTALVRCVRLLAPDDPAAAPLLEEQNGAQAAFKSASGTAPEENVHSFTVTGISCEIRGDVIHISAGRDASTYPLPQDCALTPQASGTGM